MFLRGGRFVQATQFLGHVCFQPSKLVDFVHVGYCYGVSYLLYGLVFYPYSAVESLDCYFMQIDLIFSQQELMCYADRYVRYMNLYGHSDDLMLLVTYTDNALVNFPDRRLLNGEEYQAALTDCHALSEVRSTLDDFM